MPHGYEVTFRARAADDLSPGTYHSRLAGSALGEEVALSQAAPVQVAAQVKRRYLPVLGAGRNSDIWYMGVPSSPSSPHTSPNHGTDVPLGADDGAIVPTHLLGEEDAPLKETRQTVWRVNQIFTEGRPPGILALDEGWSHVYVGLGGGGLEILNLRELQITLAW